MTTPTFTVCLIARNESKTLPRLVASLKEFQDRGGAIIVVDTGSTDGTPSIARQLGCRCLEEGDRFRRVITKQEAQRINDWIIEDGESHIVKEGDALFDFTSARNYAASLSETDMICMPDCDEIFTQFDIDKVEESIASGATQLEYDFVFSHDPDGKPAIQFKHCKFYSRSKLQWAGVVHEILRVREEGNKCVYLDPSIIKLEHYQNPETNRGGYLVGLALDCYENPENDRNSHYLARELFWSGRYWSAIAEFNRHIEMKKWPAEAGQSYIFMGDCYLKLGIEEKAVDCWIKAYLKEPARREALIRLAEYHFSKDNHQLVAAFAEAAISVKEQGFYANHHEHYTYVPHELAYWAYFYLGEHDKGKDHFKHALKYRPDHSKYLHDYRFFYDLPRISIVIPHLPDPSREEGLAKLLASIEALNYPKDKIETLLMTDEPRMGVPKRVHEAYEKSTGDYIVFAATDTELVPDSFMIAYIEMLATGKRLIAFNTGTVTPDGGNECEHFMIDKSLVPDLGGYIFDLDFYHVGVDNLLKEKSKKLSEFVRSDKAMMIHNHFSKPGNTMDAVHKAGWSHVDEDRALLARKLTELNS